MGSVWKYLDNVVALLASISAFGVHRDPRILAREIARNLYEAVEETLGTGNMGGVDKTAAVDAVDALIKAFGPAFGLRGVDTDGDGKIDEWSDL